ncbi:MAG: pyroglutamyl-peptidase I [Erysipelothrix sp.]|nr:pyroglutamyl-peptidase I [Erysipelothrix sp.]
MKLLITGFDAFGIDKINPSFQAVQLLPDKIGNIEIIKAVLPTKFIEVKEVIDKLLKEVKPDYFIAVGQAEGRDHIALEKVAINLMTARIIDNAGYQPTDKPIEADGQTAYFSNLPLNKLLKALKAKDIPSKISYSAGVFVCNTSFYHLMYLINEKKLDLKAGFIHIPLIPKQLDIRDKIVYTMELAEIVKALKIVINNL